MDQRCRGLAHATTSRNDLRLPPRSPTASIVSALCLAVLEPRQCVCRRAYHRRMNPLKRTASSLRPKHCAFDRYPGVYRRGRAAIHLMFSLVLAAAWLPSRYLALAFGVGSPSSTTSVCCASSGRGRVIGSQRLATIAAVVFAVLVAVHGRLVVIPERLDIWPARPCCPYARSRASGTRHGLVAAARTTARARVLHFALVSAWLLHDAQPARSAARQRRS
ncbi:hypothetical protein AMAG_20730 [Allomyces macrogynus ATCC 38327]|uniref:Uncharacterized protein n=1 Tax=Allomyces macrogynus (strain ATCC 38327) TaxID=578462 RepID=A0A0L0TEZ3_ALLM3|nr:hypothetical protein AMAG_20730 [Allomyces macrogynus ATCC 38327]|eukprot:KNE73265.1 hypothetical protein AMAG_20730 [Allomyces macrogynus ATCC 38327]